VVVPTPYFVKKRLLESESRRQVSAGYDLGVTEAVKMPGMPEAVFSRVRAFVRCSDCTYRSAYY
jgi:hypothetical protein